MNTGGTWQLVSHIFLCIPLHFCSVTLLGISFHVGCIKMTSICVNCPNQVSLKEISRGIY
jgi:hypothetical protein